MIEINRRKSQSTIAMHQSIWQPISSRDSEPNCSQPRCEVSSNINSIYGFRQLGWFPQASIPEAPEPQPPEENQHHLNLSPGPPVSAHLLPSVGSEPLRPTPVNDLYGVRQLGWFTPAELTATVAFRLTYFYSPQQIWESLPLSSEETEKLRLMYCSSPNHFQAPIHQRTSRRRIQSSRIAPDRFLDDASQAPVPYWSRTSPPRAQFPDDWAWPVDSRNSLRLYQRGIN